MQRFHHTLRMILPFLYERNWYTGHFEFKSDRATAFAATVVAVAVIVAVILWMGQPIEYVSPR